MDDTNRQILELLQQNARLSIKTIASRVGLARSSVRERIARMEATGVIRGYRVELASRDPLSSHIEAFLIIRLDKTPAPQTIARIVANPGVTRCSSVGGDIDVIVETCTTDIESLNRMRDEIACYPHVIDLTTAIILKRDKDAATSKAPLAKSDETSAHGVGQRTSAKLDIDTDRAR
ncbi:MAG: Lrp/AsnC family transcriptional regulator [Steroidobacter sp.]